MQLGAVCSTSGGSVVLCASDRPAAADPLHKLLASSPAKPQQSHASDSSTSAVADVSTAACMPVDQLPRGAVQDSDGDVMVLGGHGSSAPAAHAKQPAGGSGGHHSPLKRPAPQQSAEVDAQPTKKSRVDTPEPEQQQQQQAPVAAGGGSAAAADVDMELEALSAQIEALSKQLDSRPSAVPAHVRPSPPPGSSSGPARSSASPLLPSMQEQEPHQSKRSLAFDSSSSQGPGAAAAAAATGGCPKPPQQQAQQQGQQQELVSPTRPTTRMLKQSEEALAHYAMLKAKADREAAKADREAAKAAEGASRAEAAAAQAAAQQAGEPGFVPDWLREWRPKARAAAAAAAKTKEQQQRRRAQQQQQQMRSSEQPPANQSHSSQQEQQRQQHKHLALMLDALRQGLSSPDSAPSDANAAPPAQLLSALAAAAAGGIAGSALQQQQQLDDKCCFVFNADTFDARRSGSVSSSAGGGSGSQAEGLSTGSPGLSPSGDAAWAPAGRRQGSASVEPADAAAAPLVLPHNPASLNPQQLQHKLDQQQQLRQQQRREQAQAGNTLFSLPKREWQKLSAAAGLHHLQRKQEGQQPGSPELQQPEPQELQPQRPKQGPRQHKQPAEVLSPEQEAQRKHAALLAQAKVGCSNAHLARAVQSYRGVFALEGSSLYEVRMYRSKLGRVLRLKNHPDAPSAARAFDRAALCLARASMSGKPPELNFPASDYEGELLPDLRGCSPAEIRETLCNAFSGSAVLPDIATQQQQLQQHINAIITATTNAASSRRHPSSSRQADQPGWRPIKRPWLPFGFKPTAQGAAQPGAGLRWGSKKARSSSAGQSSSSSRARAGMAALLAAGVPMRGKSVKHPLFNNNPQQQQAASFYAGQDWHPAAAAAGSGPVGGLVPAAAGGPAAPAWQQHQHSSQLPVPPGVQGAQHLAAAVAAAAAMQAAGPGMWAPPGAAVPLPPAMQQQPGPQQQPLVPPAGCAELAALAKMMCDLQSLSQHCRTVEQCLQQFVFELTQDAAALESAAVSGPNTQQEVRRTVGAVEACQGQQRALQQLLTETMQLLQPTLTNEERARLHINSMRLTPELEALSAAISEVCKAVLRAVVAQDAATCAAAAAAAGQAGDVPASLDKIPAGSARAMRMSRLSRAIRGVTDCMAAARQVVGGQA